MHKPLATTLALLLVTAFVAPRAFSAVVLCHCACGQHMVVVGPADEQTADTVSHACCSHCRTEDQDSPPIRENQNVPAPGSKPCDCPADCCAGKLLSFALCLTADPLLRPLEEPLRASPVTVLSLNYHADILRPPRAELFLLRAECVLAPVVLTPAS